MEKKQLVTRFDEVRWRVEDPKQMVGKMTAETVSRKWKEDFVDKDTGEIATVERTEFVIANHHILTKEDVAKIQFHQQSGEIKDVLVTNQDRPFLYIKCGYMFEVVLKLMEGGKKRLLIQSKGLNMALAIAADWGEQVAGGDFYITSIKVADDYRIVNMQPSECDEAQLSYHVVTVEYWEELDEKNDTMTFLALGKDADQAIDIVRAVISQDEKLQEILGEYKIAVAKQSPITDIVPLDMSKAYAKYANTHEWMMDGCRVGQEAGSL